MKSVVFAVLMFVTACGGAKATPTTGNEAPPGDTQPTIAIALVYNAWEAWIGNDKEIPELAADDPSRYPGILIALRDAIDQVDFGQLGPTGSTGMVITYADAATIRVPMGPLAEIRGATLGTQKDYFNTTGRDLVAGVKLALAEVNKAPAGRRAIIIVGDGSDTNEEAARTELAALKQQASADGIAVYAIIYKGALSTPDDVISVLAADVTTVDEAVAVGPALDAIAAKLRR